MTTKEFINSMLSLQEKIANIDGKLSMLIPKIERLDTSQSNIQTDVTKIKEFVENNRIVKENKAKTIGLIVGVSSLVSGISFSIIKLVLN